MPDRQETPTIRQFHQALRPVERQELTIRREIRQIVPLSVTSRKDIEHLRAIAPARYMRVR
ncbi:MAG: hypothetical protein V3S25_09240 [Nitrospirales bacterium]